MNDGAKIKILMLASNDILNDPRVQKEAAAAAREGFEVTVAGLVSGRIGPGEEMLDGYRIIRLDDRKPELTPPVIIETAPPRGWWQNSASPWLSQTVLGRGISRVRSTLDRIKITFAGGMPHISWLGDEYGDDEAFRESLMTVNLDDEADSYRFVRRVNRVFVAEGLRWRPQVCHCNDLDSLLAGVVLKRRLGTRIVFDAHELWTEMSQAKSKQWKDHFVRYEATLLPYADAVISVNDSIGEELESRYQVKFTGRILNAPFFREVAPPAQSAIRERAAGRPVVLFQGRYEAFRGLEELVESARLLPGVLLAFRGYGSLERYLVRKVKQAGLEDRVAFFAPVEMSDLVQAAAEADVGVIPYIPTCLNNRLCTPNKLFEYMMAGLAVVASDLPELARFINQEEVGALFDPTSPESIASAINRVTSDRKTLEAMKARARAAARTRYNWDIESRRLMEIYRKLSQLPPAQPPFPLPRRVEPNCSSTIPAPEGSNRGGAAQ